MAKNTAPGAAKADVAGALHEIRSKKSRAQLKAERFHPFIPVIAEALAANWSWSAIAKLVRQHNGPSLTRKEAEALYKELDMDHAGDDDTPGDGFLADESAGTLHVSANDGEGV